MADLVTDRKPLPDRNARAVHRDNRPSAVATGGGALPFPTAQAPTLNSAAPLPLGGFRGASRATRPISPRPLRRACGPTTSSAYPINGAPIRRGAVSGGAVSGEFFVARVGL